LRATLHDDSTDCVACNARAGWAIRIKTPFAGNGPDFHVMIGNAGQVNWLERAQRELLRTGSRIRLVRETGNFERGGG